MRYPDDRAAHGLKFALTIPAALALAGCGMFAADAGPIAASAYAAPTANGPQADYPVTIGEPYAVAGTTYTPADTLNYDEVGYAGAVQGQGITGAHHTLPVPSYVEVTSLETGRTILVRLEQRGPMDSTALVALSPAALAQLEASAQTPVRVRRVNPPEDQRALLRAGQSSPLRMDTPMALVEVLRRRLPGQGSTSLQAAVDALTAPEQFAGAPAQEPLPPVSPAVAPTASAAAPPPLPPLESAQRETVAEVFAPEERAASQQPVADGNFVVQAAAFSTEDRARRAASALGGEISRAGRFFQVRTGPFASRAQAEASLANVRAAGYSDARILTQG